MEKQPAVPLPPPSGILPAKVPTGPSLDGLRSLFHRNGGSHPAPPSPPAPPKRD